MWGNLFHQLENAYRGDAAHRQQRHASRQQHGSDFVLCEVNQPIPEEWQPYYAGWDASGYNGTSGVSIHHPNGDRKKISTFTSPLTSGSWSPWTSTNAHWRVIWSPTETDHGVTEGGSSGSPIFEENHRIIGTLTEEAPIAVNHTKPTSMAR